MILSDRDITRLLESGELKINPLPKLRGIRGASIDLHISPVIARYKSPLRDLKDDSTFAIKDEIIISRGYEFPAKGFRLGSTVEKICMPNGYCGKIATKSTIARAGIQVHGGSDIIDPGFNGHIVLELTNNSEGPVRIYPHEKFLELYISKMSSKSDRPYSGKYQGQNGAVPSRRARIKSSL